MFDERCGDVCISTSITKAHDGVNICMLERKHIEPRCHETVGATDRVQLHNTRCAMSQFILQCSCVARVRATSCSVSQSAIRVDTSAVSRAEVCAANHDDSTIICKWRHARRRLWTYQYRSVVRTVNLRRFSGGGSGSCLPSVASAKTQCRDVSDNSSHDFNADHFEFGQNESSSSDL